MPATEVEAPPMNGRQTRSDKRDKLMQRATEGVSSGDGSLPPPKGADLSTMVDGVKDGPVYVRIQDKSYRIAAFTFGQFIAAGRAIGLIPTYFMATALAVFDMTGKYIEGADPQTELQRTVELYNQLQNQGQTDAEGTSKLTPETFHMAMPSFFTILGVDKDAENYIQAMTDVVFMALASHNPGMSLEWIRDHVSAADFVEILRTVFRVNDGFRARFFAPSSKA